MNRQIASGASWMVLFKLVDRLLAVVSTIILARLLVPEDFGLVAMAMSVLAVVELATSFGFDVALIQRRELDRTHYDTAWTLNVLLALCCSLVIALLAAPAASFYQEPRLTTVMLVLAAGWVVGGFENVGIVDFRRQLRFRREFAFLVLRRTGGFLVTAALAVALRSYWALVLGSISAKVLGLALSYAMHAYRPRFGLQAARELIGFSVWVLANNLVTVLQSKIPHFVVGRLLGAHPLGVLTISSEIAQVPATDLAAPINRAVFPGFSRMASDLETLRRSFLNVVAMGTLVAVPAAVGIAAVAEPLVRTALGEAWMEAVPIIQVLAIAGAVAAVTSYNGAAYLALGRPRLLAFVLAVRLAILLPLTVGLAQAFGLLGVAFAELLTSVLITTVSVPLLFVQLKLPLRGYLSRIWRPAAAGTAMAAGVLWVVDALPFDTGLESFRTLVAGVAAGLVLYPATVVLLWNLGGRPAGAEAILYAKIRSLLGAKQSDTDPR
jgi:lipopolysaccharide exporter